MVIVYRVNGKGLFDIGHTPWRYGIMLLHGQCQMRAGSRQVVESKAGLEDTKRVSRDWR